jgi:hypothetical protein
MDAATVKLPRLPLAWSAGAVAFPWLSVTAVAVGKPWKAPPDPVTALGWTVNVTVTPLTTLPNESVMWTSTGVRKTAFGPVVRDLPATMLNLAGGPATLVRSMSAGLFIPLTWTVTTKLPARVLAVNAGAVATPLPSLTTVTVFPPPNVPLAEHHRVKPNGVEN